MKVWMSVLLAGLASSGAFAQPATNAPAAAMAEAVASVVEVLAKQGLVFDANVAQQAAIDAIIETADPLGHVITEADAAWMEAQEKGVFTEVNLRVAVTNGVAKIVDVTAGSPAEEAGLKAGDVLEEIDKGSVEGFSLADIGDFLRGPADERVTLKVKDASGESRVVDVARGPVTAPAVRVSEDWPANICYLRLNGLYADSGKDIVPLIRGWAASGRDGLILDLRGAGGADVESVTAVASAFSPAGALLFSFRDGANQDVGVFKASAGGAADLPAMVLVDERTTGAAEVLAAVLGGSVKGAMLIGVPSAADPMVRERVAGPAGIKLYVTTRRLVVADGTVYDGRDGVHPDVVVDMNLGDAADYEPGTMPRGDDISDEEKEHTMLRQRVRGDASLQRAVDVLLGLKALDIRGTRRTDRSSP